MEFRMVEKPTIKQSQVGLPLVRQVTPGAVSRWLRLGWRDFRRAGWPSLMHGVIVTGMSLVIVGIALLFWPLLPGAVSGFLVVGPILATGLYSLSRRLEQGQAPGLSDVFYAWRCASRCLLRFGLLLVLGATAWVLLSMTLFHFFVEVEISGPTDFLRYVILQDDGMFMGWTVLAGLVAAVAFAGSVVSVPLLVDRDVTTPLAIRTSVRAVGENPVTMTVWALFILMATAFSVATLMLGFIVIYPVLGHASWHVYRDVVNAGRLAPRKPVN
jgi:uncharacterized membrane protein